MADAAKFFARWARLKRQARKSALANERTPKDAPASAEPQPTELPPLESLTAQSDYTAFMRPDVADAARNAALQKLWRSDPVFANLDGLVEYGEDYAAAFKVSAAVRTAYRVAQGMVGTVPEAEATEQTALPSKNDAAPNALQPTQSGIEPSPTSLTKDGSDM